MPRYASSRRELGRRSSSALPVGVSSFLPSLSTNIILLLLAVVGVSNCHGTCHSFDVP